MTRESRRYHELHGSPEAIARRAALVPAELARLGLPEGLVDGLTVDVGCGFGEVLQALPGVGARVGLDLHARRLTVPYVRASADALPFADGSVGNVLCLHTLHHLDDVATVGHFLDEARRVLRPGGRLALLDHRDSPLLRVALAIALRVAPEPLRSQLREEWLGKPRFYTNWRAIEEALARRGFVAVRRRAGLLSVACVLSRGGPA